MPYQGVSLMFDLKNLEEAINLGSILSFEESIMSYIFDTVNRKKLTLQGK